MRFIIAVILCLVFSSQCWADSKTRDVRLGNKLFKEGQYGDSIKKYSRALDKEPNSDIINFNIGTAFYKNNEYEKAIQHLNRSLLTEDDRLQATSYYNLGNALYKAGIAKENDDLNTAIHSLEESISHYEKALQINGDDEDAKYNHEYVSRELERLKKKLQEQKKQENQQGQNQPQPKKNKNNKEQEGKSPDRDKQESQDSQRRENKGKDKSREENAQKREPEVQSGSQQKKESEQPSSPSARESASVNAQQMTNREAQMLLDQYQQSEQPKGLLNTLMGKRKSREVEKDW